MTERGSTSAGRLEPSVGMSGWLAARLPVYYGWVIVAVGALGLLCGGPGQSSTIAVFMDPMIADLGLSRSALAGAYTIGNLIAALLMGPVGRLTDRYGGRNVLATGVALLGATCLLMGRVEGFVGLAVGFTGLRLMVQGPLTLTGTTLVAQWFVRRRGRAQSLMSLGMTVGFAIFPPLTVFLIDRLTWRPAWAAIGLLVWLALLPAVLLLVRSRPEEMGFRPDGATPARPATADAGLAPTDDERSWTARQATRTLTFWLLSGSIAVTWLVGAGLNFHQVSILVGEGHTTSFAASIFAVSALASIPATFACGWLLDRGSPRRVLTALLLIQALAAWWLLGSGPPLMALVYGALNGVMIGASNVVNAVVFAAYYGRRHLGSIRGVTMIVNVAASALGPLPLGLARDLLGSYAPALIALGLLPCLYALAMAWVRPPARSEE